MKALSISQPWAWMIVHGWKDIENRQWSTRLRGRILVHASKGMTREEYQEAFCLAREIRGLVDTLPSFLAIERGGIIGSVEIWDCVTQSESPWFFGPYGFALRDPMIITFKPFKGSLGFFDVPDELLEGWT